MKPGVNHVWVICWLGFLIGWVWWISQRMLMRLIRYKFAFGECTWWDLPINTIRWLNVSGWRGQRFMWCIVWISRASSVFFFCGGISSLLDEKNKAAGKTIAFATADTEIETHEGASGESTAPTAIYPSSDQKLPSHCWIFDGWEITGSNDYSENIRRRCVTSTVRYEILSFYTFSLFNVM